MKRPFPFPSLDLNRLSLTALDARPSKVGRETLAKSYAAGQTFEQFWNSLPDVLAVRDLRALVAGVAQAHQDGKAIAVGAGGHVIKTGLAPIIVDLMRDGIVNAVATNGSVCIHDVELAIAGKTSEDVDASLRDGSFGMSRETAGFILKAIADAGPRVGLGRALGDALLARNAKFASTSLLAQGAALDVPVTVHVAIGTDIIHMHPEADGAALGAASLFDFRRFTEVIAAVTDGGAYLNFGSAVVLPEVFLKALSIARNLGYRNNFVTADFDFIRHYRTRTNVVVRPHLDGGRGYMFTGHHEIMLPLFAAGVRAAIAAHR
ncbi:MAG TPA: hypothetical protein VID19_00420 [Candidatus Eremiobacteraceae bacterium]